MAAPAKVMLSVVNLPNGQRQAAAYYLFAKAGDEIPLHDHAFFHSCFCVAGACEIYDDAGKRVAIEAGETIEFPAQRKHAIRALVDGTQTFNVNEPGV